MDIDCAWRYDQREIDIDLVDAGPHKNGNLTSGKMREQSRYIYDPAKVYSGGL